MLFTVDLKVPDKDRAKQIKEREKAELANTFNGIGQLLFPSPQKLYPGMGPPSWGFVAVCSKPHQTANFSAVCTRNSRQAGTYQPDESLSDEMQ